MTTFLKILAVLGAASALYACAYNKPDIYLGRHLNTIDHAGVEALCHGHAGTGINRHCHDRRAETEKRTAWY